ncbi:MULTISPECIES: molybdopterin-dependent oxidoreductase [unclassified Actinopolyspora]|uniref:molybdopterin-dependent oxidoreductase n=1 Tax=unclassified Actinopolyspora TaxID=2639451 RepID=UPI0013F63DA5|nr:MULTISPECIES: molybdopterin-dependent oxidoreductase [unclassified Actinopolyspora]NHD16171.1 molybdopterin-dependent oxidoreductase [Actinopolyspora sp. BKK2]NHE74615.1 molybdopterin-dependent oxidoreductase [Actinopolyspora sp. BKK1]
MRVSTGNGRPGAFRAVLASVAAVALALGVGHLIAGLIQPNSSPYLVVGNTAIDLVPQPVKQFAIRQFGESDKLVLLGGMGVVILLLAVVAGLLSRRGVVAGLVVIAAFGALGVVAALLRADLTVLGALPALAALVVGSAGFVLLHRLAARPGAAGDGSAGSGADAEVQNGRSASRRTFVLGTVAVSAAAGASAAGGRVLARSAGVAADRTRVARVVPANPPIPAGADFSALGTPSFITPNRDFYRVDTALSVPRVALDDWRLRVHGMLDRELVLGFDDLLRRRSEQRTVTMTCVSNQVGGDYVSTATFTGVPIRDILDEVGVRPGAEQVFSTSEDGYTAGTPLDVLREEDRGALLAYGMNGEALPVEHGFPVRMVTPGLYGYLSATKWLVDMELTTFDRQTYWEKRGWAERAPIKPQSRIDRPTAFQKFPAGRFTVAGIAWAQPTGVDHVEVRVDGGPWQRADLSTEVSGETWRMWRAELEFSPGGHNVECRATDRSGYTQVSRRVPPVPDGATGWHSISCTAT